MKVALVFPPAADPRAPHLGIAALQAALRDAGMGVDVHDLDIQGLRALSKREKIERSLVSLERAGWRGLSDTDRLRIQSKGARVYEDIERAYRIFKDEPSFLDPHQLMFARDTIEDALDIVCAANPRAVRYGLSPIDYRLPGIDERWLMDLIAACEDPGNNLFFDYWRGEFLPSLERSHPDMVGLSIVNGQQLIPGLMLARLLKERGWTVVIGGTYFTKFAEKLETLPLFFEYFTDFLIVNDGETALLELLDQMEGKGRYSQVPNLLYVSRGRVRRNAPYVEDVGRLPTPDYSGFPLDAYLAPRPVLPISIGRGCYYDKCKFCDIPFASRIAKKKYRIRSVEQVADDISELAARFGARDFVFTDESLPPRLLDRLCEALPRPARYSFAGYARLEPGFTPSLCGRLAAAGMRKLYFGMESGDQRMLDHMSKGTKAKDAGTVLSACKEAGIRFHLFSMVGLPEESEEMARSTHSFFIKNKAVIDIPGNTFDIHKFGLELRTPYFDRWEEYGLAVDALALEGDFVMGVPDAAWVNGRGLDKERTECLLEEFTEDLRQRFRRWHHTLAPLWPMHEEYAVLYCDHYRRDEDFRYLTSMPRRDDGALYQLNWHPSSTAVPRGNEYLVANRRAKVKVSQGLYSALNTNRSETLDDLYLRVALHVSPVQTNMDRLLSSSLAVLVRI